jgi:hypothetical protein
MSKLRLEVWTANGEAMLQYLPSGICWFCGSGSCVVTSAHMDHEAPVGICDKCTGITVALFESLDAKPGPWKP